MTTAAIDVIPKQGQAIAPYQTVVQEMLQQTLAIQECMRVLMKEGTHYGIIPGTPKPSLWKPGADLLCMQFRLRPTYRLKVTESDGLVSVTARCRLYHVHTGQLWGEGHGSANTREKKYAAQSTSKLCPKCKKPTIIKGSEKYGGGWVCWEKKGGCKAKFKDDDETITSQEGEPQTNGVWDLHNTIVKMATKRARIDAVLTATAASDIFTQDMEDLADAVIIPKQPEATPVPKGAAPSTMNSGANDTSKSSTTPDTSTTPTTTSDSTETRTTTDPGEAPDEKLMKELLACVGDLRWAVPKRNNWLKKHFDAANVNALTKMQATTVLQVLMAWQISKEAYEAAMAKAIAEGLAK